MRRGERHLLLAIAEKQWSAGDGPALPLFVRGGRPNSPWLDARSVTEGGFWRSWSASYPAVVRLVGIISLCM